MLLPINKVTSGQERFVGAKAGDTLTFNLGEAFGGDAGAIRSFSGLSKEEASAATGDYELAVEKINRTAAPEENQELFDKVFGPEAVWLRKRNSIRRCAKRCRRTTTARPITS